MVDQQLILVFEAVKFLHDLSVLVLDSDVIRGSDLRDAALEVETQLLLLSLAHLRTDVFDLDSCVFDDIFCS